MQFKVPMSFTSTADVYRHDNPNQVGLDNYVPSYSFVKTISVFVAVDPVTGKMNIQTPEPIDVALANVRNVRDSQGRLMTQADSLYRLNLATPILDAYGRLVQYKYYMNGIKV